jgi:hypothetical protein
VSYRLSDDPRPRWLVRDRRNGRWLAVYSAQEAALAVFDARKGPYSREGASGALRGLNGPPTRGKQKA